MTGRKYQLRERAEQQRETRERIVDAAVALHEEIGPAATTVKALAERAGVQRLTVYRHFPDQDAILTACSEKWFAANPPPAIDDTSRKHSPADVDQDEFSSTRQMLGELYGYYGKTQGMWTSLYRDYGTVPALDAPMSQFEGYLDAAGKRLAALWAPRRSRQLRATISHAVSFSTWQSLHDRGLGTAAMARLVATWIAAAAGR